MAVPRDPVGWGVVCSAGLQRWARSWSRSSATPRVPQRSSVESNLLRQRLLAATGQSLCTLEPLAAFKPRF